jgi:hypothetical protein
MNFVVENKSGRTLSGPVQFSLIDVLAGTSKESKNTLDVSAPTSGFEQRITLSDYFDTPRTGGYCVRAFFNGNYSNDLPIKILL